MDKTREGDGGSPYTKPPKPHPGPFVPAPNPKKLAKNKNKKIVDIFDEGNTDFY